jgi:hypothetical protein
MARLRGSARSRRQRRVSNNDEEGESISNSIHSPDEVEEMLGEEDYQESDEEKSDETVQLMRRVGTYKSFVFLHLGISCVCVC